jgi:hypothetical protein
MSSSPEKKLTASSSTPTPVGRQGTAPMRLLSFDSSSLPPSQRQSAEIHQVRLDLINQVVWRRCRKHGGLDFLRSIPNRSNKLLSVWMSDDKNPNHVIKRP